MSSQQYDISENVTEEPSISIDIGNLDWFHKLKLQSNYVELEIKEWNDEEWRINEGGFKGFDFCHSPTANVRILEYILLKPDISSVSETRVKLVGPVYFSPKAESHRGLCHGGSMCAVMDDALGWMGFCSGDVIKPWSGYTVQVNTALRKPVPVGSILKLESFVDRLEGPRKVWVKAVLSEPGTGEVYCEADGLFLKSKEEL